MNGRQSKQIRRKIGVMQTVNPQALLTYRTAKKLFKKLNSGQKAQLKEAMESNGVR